ncbi:hypothetical protein RKD26_003709 [Streptomyces calvus]|uniref:hypothetical protein n=1 Tax=Streptomyces calvus TaxID=67282 RepID=UPI003515C083
MRGTRDEARDAADRLAERPAEYAPRFTAGSGCGTGSPGRHVASAVERLRAGGDVPLGFCLERPAYLSVSLVTCSPNRARPEPVCPVGAHGPGAYRAGRLSG